MRSVEEKVSLKRVVRGGKGLCIYITKEANRMKMEPGDYVAVTIVEDSKGEKMEIRKAKIS